MFGLENDKKGPFLSHKNGAFDREVSVSFAVWRVKEIDIS